MSLASKMRNSHVLPDVNKIIQSLNIISIFLNKKLYKQKFYKSILNLKNNNNSLIILLSNNYFVINLKV